MPAKRINDLPQKNRPDGIVIDIYPGLKGAPCCAGMTHFLKSFRAVLRVTEKQGRPNCTMAVPDVEIRPDIIPIDSTLFAPAVRPFSP